MITQDNFNKLHNERGTDIKVHASYYYRDKEDGQFDVPSLSYNPANPSDHFDADQSNLSMYYEDMFDEHGESFQFHSAAGCYETYDDLPSALADMMGRYKEGYRGGHVVHARLEHDKKYLMLLIYWM